MSIGTRTHARDNRLTERPRRTSYHLASIKCTTDVKHLSQPRRPHQNQTHQKADPTPTRRQLASTFGTLLSSQGTDAHPFRFFNLSGGNRSNLAGSLLRVKSRGDRFEGAHLPCRHQGARGSMILFGVCDPWGTGRRSCDRCPFLPGGAWTTLRGSCGPMQGRSAWRRTRTLSACPTGNRAPVTGKANGDRPPGARCSRARWARRARSRLHSRRQRHAGQGIGANVRRPV